MATDSTAALQHLKKRIDDFHALWQRAWRQSETQRVSEPYGAAFLPARAPLLHCHPGTPPEDQQVSTYWRSGESFAQVDFQYAQIRSSRSLFAVCPTWQLVEGMPSVQDERIVRDGALLPALREAVRKQRAAVLVGLDSAARQWPGDSWIAGQRVRLLFDQGETQGALTAALSCRAAGWWCAALMGYAYSRRNDLAEAERAFRDMRTLMSPLDRCRWEDVSDLLAAANRKAYTSLDCDARASVNTRLWWLSDPLFRIAGNERYVEQQTRRVEIALHRLLPKDERYSWGDRQGGDALGMLVNRYGWPSYTAWGGDSIDDDHSDYLETRNSPAAAPYTTFEYSLDRVSTLPSWAAVLHPFNAPESSWWLSWDDTIGRPFTVWWPDEHFRPARRLVQFSEGQSALLRRETQALVALSVQFNHPLLEAEAKFTDSGGFRTVESGSASIVPTFDVMLLSSRSDGHTDSLAHRVVQGGTTVAMRGLVNSSPTIIAIEAVGTGTTAVDARTRFGTTPPPSLRSMRAGELAISDPVLFDAAKGDGSISAPDESLLNRMLGTVRLDAKHRRVGVYWETYGVAASDTVTIAVRVATDQALGSMRRLGMALNVAANPNRAVVQRWTEPDARRNTRTMAGTVPVQSRALVLNLDLLQTDTYVLEISVERADGRMATARRRITIER